MLLATEGQACQAHVHWLATALLMLSASNDTLQLLCVLVMNTGNARVTLSMAMQAGGLDVMAMTVAASAALSKPLHIMTVSKPSQIVNDTKGRTLLTNVIVFHAVTMVVGMLLLSKQSWYQGESYPSRQVGSLLSCHQLVPAMLPCIYNVLLLSLPAAAMFMSACSCMCLVQ